MPAVPALHWLRLDLRLADNPALHDTCRAGGAVIPVYVWSPGEDGDWPPGAASRYWLHRSLASLDASLRAVGSRLVLRQGAAADVLSALVRETGARLVSWNHRYEPAAIRQASAVAARLEGEGIRVRTGNAGLLTDPGALVRANGQPWRVFTPFWKACLKVLNPPEPLAAPATFAAPARWPASDALSALGLEPGVDWAGGIRRAWRFGEAAAHERLNAFLDGAFAEYHTAREVPGSDGTSRLSPHLHFGEVGPRQVWWAVRTRAALGGTPAVEQAADRYLAELGWREFAHYMLYHVPRSASEPLRPEFARFPWRPHPGALRAWQRGRTGYPLVDAGMRQLWHTGWMHNRVRMVVASFLVKDLLVPWQDGARWFWDTLVDADLANNTQGWQWTAGCGADAAPFFRIFNPSAQGERHDPAGDYVRQWVPELAALPDAWIHRPWEAPSQVLAGAAIRLGETYPHPMVDHARAREEALAAYQFLRSGGPVG